MYEFYVLISKSILGANTILPSRVLQLMVPAYLDLWLEQPIYCFKLQYDYQLLVPELSGFGI